MRRKRRRKMRYESERERERETAGLRPPVIKFHSTQTLDWTTPI